MVRFVPIVRQQKFQVSVVFSPDLAKKQGNFMRYTHKSYE